MKLTERDVIIDVETRSALDITSVGTYRYCLDASTRLLLFSFSVGTSDDVYTFDVANGEQIPQEVLDVLVNPYYKKHAHNAPFEILILHNTLGMPLLYEQWYCSQVAVGYCGIPLSLDDSGSTLNARHHKMSQGKELIKFFSCPRKDNTFNEPQANQKAWQDFIAYNKGDVLAEKSNLEALPEIPEVFEAGRERDMWLLDQRINCKGIEINAQLAINADAMCEREDVEFVESVKGLGINNPNSRKQVIDFLKERGIHITTLKAEDYDTLLDKAAGDEIATRLIEAKRQLSLSSASKFSAATSMLLNGRAYGTLQYYGAIRTGRWAGRGVQPQNMKRNEMPFEYLSLLRGFVIANDYDSIKMYFGNVKENIVELGRTMLQPSKGNKFASSDFSAIEARVTAWIANEQWRLDVFNTHGKIYEASAARMFKVDVSTITKGSKERIKGKFAELALGFGGWVDAFKRFGAEKFMTDKEMLETAIAWREASPNVVRMWHDTFDCVIQAVKDEGNPYTTKYGVTYKVEVVRDAFNGVERKWLTCLLMSGRRLMYYQPELCISRGKLSFKYRRAANEQDTWYGIMVENVVQGIARDLLVEKLLHLDKMYGITPTFHVHDEIVVEAPDDSVENMRQLLNNVMSLEVAWAKGLPLKGDTEVLPFYMKGE